MLDRFGFFGGHTTMGGSGLPHPMYAERYKTIFASPSAAPLRYPHHSTRLAAAQDRTCSDETEAGFSSPGIPTDVNTTSPHVFTT